MRLGPQEKRTILGVVRPFEMHGELLFIAPSPHLGTDFDAIWRVSAQGSALLGSHWSCSPYWGWNTPKPRFWGCNYVGIFKPNAQNIKICILSKLLLRIQPNFAQWERPLNTLRGWSKHAYDKFNMGPPFLEIKNRHISFKVWPMNMKFDKVTYTNPPNRICS